MSKMPEDLEETRRFLALEYGHHGIRSDHPYDYYSFVDGFNACYTAMDEREKQAVEMCEKLNSTLKTAYGFVLVHDNVGLAKNMIEETLAEYAKFKGER